LPPGGVLGDPDGLPPGGGAFGAPDGLPPGGGFDGAPDGLPPGGTFGAPDGLPPGATAGAGLGLFPGGGLPAPGALEVPGLPGGLPGALGGGFGLPGGFPEPGSGTALGGAFPAGGGAFLTLSRFGRPALGALGGGLPGGLPGPGFSGGPPAWVRQITERAKPYKLELYLRVSASKVHGGRSSILPVRSTPVIAHRSSRRHWRRYSKSRRSGYQAQRYTACLAASGAVGCRLDITAKIGSAGQLRGQPTDDHHPDGCRRADPAAMLQLCTFPWCGSYAHRPLVHLRARALSITCLVLC